MNAKYLVHPIRSIRSFDLSKQERGMGSDGLLRAILDPVRDGERRYPANVVVFGADGKHSQGFADMVRDCCQPRDAIWRVGDRESDTCDLELWVSKDDSLLKMINARVVFVPGEQGYASEIEDWKARSDFFLVGPGEKQKVFVEFDASRRAVWPGLYKPPVSVPPKSPPSALPPLLQWPLIPATVMHGGPEQEEQSRTESQHVPEGEYRQEFPELGLSAVVTFVALGETKITFTSVNPDLAGVVFAFHNVQSGKDEDRGIVNFAHGQSVAEWQDDVALVGECELRIVEVKLR
ncbi:MAG: hypothetical protein NTY38_21850 [Acidobacteria bacterium]|nr:hypothetical protein [Acidobacteriota bacterium]